MPVTRRSVIAAAAPAYAPAGLIAAPAESGTVCADTASDQEVRDLVFRSAQAHAALMRGDLKNYRSFISFSNEFTLMTPFGGGPSRAADLSGDRMEAIARFFKNGSNSTLDLVQAYRSVDLVVLVAIERSHVGVGDIPEQDWSLRVTLVFRKEHGQWVLAHRHADPLVSGISLKEAAELAVR